MVRGALAPVALLGSAFHVVSMWLTCQAWACGNVVRRSGVGWSPQFLGLCLVERQLDLTSVAARLGGSSVWFVRLHDKR
ncbi:hypothetical protein Taro_024838 [Colocasia esculenta]|uniref:Secreted protein n=1 Tax=Colocasia esculenta TaxID=4460 RepID=A0A843VAH4_COLES|nr:hypothetical protein [Colocasia esculenta]